MKSKITTWNIILDRPTACFEHQSTQKTQTVIRTTKQALILYNWLSLFFPKKIKIFLLPYLKWERYIQLNWRRIPLSINNLWLGLHHLQVSKKDTKIWPIEHILAISWGLNIFFNLLIEWWDSIPNLPDWISTHIKQIFYDIIDTDEEIKYFTVKEPTLIEYSNGSYIALYPDNWDKKLTIDLMIDYPDKNIKKQRIIVDIDDELFKIISWARTSSYNRTKLLLLVEKYPCLRKTINLWLDNVFAFDKDKLVNPKEQFQTNWTYLELVFHEIIDKLWIWWVDLNSKKRFVWKIVTYKSSHKTDLDMLKKIDNWEITLDNI